MSKKKKGSTLEINNTCITKLNKIILYKICEATNDSFF